MDGQAAVLLRPAAVQLQPPPDTMSAFEPVVAPALGPAMPAFACPPWGVIAIPPFTAASCPPWVNAIPPSTPASPPKAAEPPAAALTHAGTTGCVRSVNSRSGIAPQVAESSGRTAPVDHESPICRAPTSGALASVSSVIPGIATP